MNKEFFHDPMPFVEKARRDSNNPNDRVRAVAIAERRAAEMPKDDTEQTRLALGQLARMVEATGDEKVQYLPPDEQS